MQHSSVTLETAQTSPFEASHPALGGSGLGTLVASTWCTEFNAFRAWLPSLVFKGCTGSPRPLVETCYSNGAASPVLCFQRGGAGLGNRALELPEYNSCRQEPPSHKCTVWVGLQGLGRGNLCPLCLVGEIRS